MLAALTVAGWHEQLLRAVITDSEWYIDRNELTGTILSRRISAVVAVKTQAGICRYFDLTFEQAHNGASYGKTRLKGVGSSVDLPCGRVGD